MIDIVIKICLLCSIPALVDYWVYRATGVPLDQSLWWWLRNFGELPAVVLVMCVLTGLVFTAFAFLIANGLYESLVSRPQQALSLGYHDGKEHYLMDGGGQAGAVSIHDSGPGESRLDRVHQPTTLMYNPLSKLYWPLADTRNIWLQLIVVGGVLVFALAAFGEAHVRYMDAHFPGLLETANAGGGRPAPRFIKALFAYAVSNPIPFVLLAASIAGGMVMQSHQRKTAAGRLAAPPLPAAIKPGATVTATLADTHVKHVSRSHDHVGEAKYIRRYSAIFEVAGLYPHTVWVSSNLGSDLPDDKDDGRYPSLDDDLEKRTEYENARPLFEKLERLKASRPQMKVKVTENLTLDWTVEPSLTLFDAGSSPPRRAASAR